jgi:hypothetical protein
MQGRDKHVGWEKGYVERLKVRQGMQGTDKPGVCMLIEIKGKGEGRDDEGTKGNGIRGRWKGKDGVSKGMKARDKEGFLEISFKGKEVRKGMRGKGGKGQVVG